MPDKPILIFPTATVAARTKLAPDKRRPPPRPSRRQQYRRLAQRFQDLGKQFGTVHEDVSGVAPEEVLVFETVGSLSDFQSAVRRLPGMEWLGDFDTDIAEPEPGFLADGTEQQDLPGRLFVVASSREAYHELQRLWNRWSRAKAGKLPFGFGSLAKVFSYLQDVRPWGVQDRVRATGVVEAWEMGLARNDPRLRFEVQLWWRGERAARDAAYKRLAAVVGRGAGQCVAHAPIPEIEYDGVLVDLPAPAIRETVDALRAGDDTELLRLTAVQSFVPMGHAATPLMSDGSPTRVPQSQLPTGAAQAALLDGLPLANHAALQDRLIVDDPDNFASQYQVGEHRHGTAMASLIVHGELDAREPALASKIYVRPVMRPRRAPNLKQSREEAFPEDQLVVDLVHRAVKRIAEGERDEPPQAPSVRVINLSVGDRSQPFDRSLSVWARLLDWLSWKYRILFVVSAGNHLMDLSLGVPLAAIAGLKAEELRAHVIRAMAESRLHRRLLAPAESVNALTVGALHAQAAPTGNPGRLVDLLRGAALPSPVNPVASGFRRSVKPEILVPGGSLHHAAKIVQRSKSNADFEITTTANQPGQAVAAPGGTATPPSHTMRMCGTSNAAALTTRAAVQLIERIQDLRREPGGDALDDARTAVLIKAMLVHGAAWEDWQEFLDTTFDGNDQGPKRWWRIKRACAQLLGYGAADFDRGTTCTDQRVVLLGCGELDAERAHIYQMPLPQALHAKKIARRITATLAWLTPVSPRARSYCCADLWFDLPAEEVKAERSDMGAQMVRQGTVQHEVLDADAAIAITEGDTLPVQVNCRADAVSRLDAPVPYALMVSLEVAPGIGVSIYDQVKVALDRLRAPVTVQPGA